MRWVPDRKVRRYGYAFNVAEKLAARLHECRFVEHLCFFALYIVSSADFIYMLDAEYFIFLIFFDKILVVADKHQRARTEFILHDCVRRQSSRQIKSLYLLRADMTKNKLKPRLYRTGKVVVPGRSLGRSHDL